MIRKLRNLTCLAICPYLYRLQTKKKKSLWVNLYETHLQLTKISNNNPDKQGLNNKNNKNPKIAILNMLESDLSPLRSLK